LVFLPYSRGAFLGQQVIATVDESIRELDPVD